MSKTIIASILIIISCVPLVYSTNAQNRADSLKNILQTSTNKNQRIEILNELYHEIRYDSVDLAKTIAIEALKLVSHVSSKKQKARAYYNMGMSYYDIRKIDSSNYFYNKSLSLYQNLKDTSGIILSLKDIGLNHFTRNQHVKAQEYYITALQMAEEGNHSKLAIEINNQIGFIYIQQEKFDTGLKYLLKSYELTKHNIDTDLVKTIFNIANVMERAKRYDEALIYLDTMLVYTNQLDFTYGKGKAYGLKSYVLNEIKQYDEAYEAIDEAIDIFSSLGADIDVFQLIIAKARVDQERGDFQNMYKEMQKAKKIISTIEDTGLLFEYNDAFYSCYKNLGMYQKALEIHEKLYALRDSIFNVGNAEKINELTTKYETEKKDQEISNLSQQAEIQNLKIQRSNIMLIGVAILFMLSILIFKVWNQRKVFNHRQAVAEIEQKVLRLQMNPHFIFNALGSIQNFILKNDSKLASIFLSKFSKLMRKTLEFSREETVTLAEEKELLTNYLEIQRLSSGQQFEYTIAIDDRLNEEEVNLPPMLAQPFIENAIEHGKLGSFDDGKLDVLFYSTADKLVLTITDNGVGISNKSSKNHKSLSTQITKERLKILEEKYKTKLGFELSTIAKTEERKETQVKLWLPLIT